MAEDYTTDRGLLEYQIVLGTEFTRRLLSLTEVQHWVDAGAGQALAARDYLRQQGGRARVTALGLDRPADPRDVKADAQFRYLEGRFEEMSLAEIGQADLITDVYGPLQYATQPDEVVLRYGQLLKVGGILWIAIPAGMLLINEADTAIEVHDWLAAVEGLTPLPLPEGTVHLRDAAFIRTDFALNVPPLRLERLVPGPPPERQYRVHLPVQITSD